MVKMLRETPIAFGLTMVICLALFFYCWYIRKLRNRFVSVHVSATPEEVHQKTGIEKEVVDSFPTVKTHELRVNIKDELQCPICLIEYADAETLRKLPQCGHVFHIHCVDLWLANQITCPVCRIDLTGTRKLPQQTAANYLQQQQQQQQQQSASYCRSSGPSTPTSVTIEVPSAATPTWVLLNRPLPLPPADIPPPQNPDIEMQHSETKLGLPGHEPPGWGAVFLQKSTPTAGFSFRSRSADIAIIESKDCISHSSISERWMTESFSFGNNSSSVESLDVAEMYRCSTHLPLTVSPEHCSFEFLPIVTGHGGDCSLNVFR